VHGVDLTVDDTGKEWDISAYLDCGINGIPNVWWLRVRRDPDRRWLIERYVEIYPEGEEERTTTTFEPVALTDSLSLPGSLPELARELLAVPPPSVQATGPQAS
jgi:hypothetical protein